MQDPLVLPPEHHRQGRLVEVARFSNLDRVKEPACLARVGHLDLRSEAEFASALRADTPRSV